MKNDFDLYPEIAVEDWLVLARDALADCLS